MVDDPVLSRIDRTLDRIDARLKSSDERWQQERERWEEERERWEEERAESRRWYKDMHEENRRYNDALLERHARITADQIAAIEAIRVQSAADSAGLQAEIADQRSQIQAQTDALLKVLDRLPPERPQG